MIDFFHNIKLLIREWSEFKRFCSSDNEVASRLVFYSEHGAYGKFYNPILTELLKIASFSYLTSDPEDPAFKLKPEQMKVFYIKSLLGGLLPQLKARVLVMTMPDLGQYHLKRSQMGTEHVYLFHALVSTHMIYRKGAFDHYDTVLCAGPHHINEIRRAEKIYGLRPKKLIEAGYPLLDKIYLDYQSYVCRGKEGKEQGGPLALIAPSWGAENIMVSCLGPLVRSLKSAGFRIIIRPHPEFIKRYPKELDQFKKNPDFFKGVEFEINSRQEESLFEADVLITDWSGIAAEYAFGTERPVLFMDTPRKVLNSEYEKIGIEPLEVTLRNVLGERLLPVDAHEAGRCALQLLGARRQYEQVIRTKRNESVFNFGESAAFITNYLQGLLI